MILLKFPVTITENNSPRQKKTVCNNIVPNGIYKTALLGGFQDLWDRQPRTIPTKGPLHYRSWDGLRWYFWGVVCELSEPKQQQNTHHPQSWRLLLVNFVAHSLLESFWILRIDSRLVRANRPESLGQKRESSPNVQNFRPEFCPEFCSEFSPNSLRDFHALFCGKRRPQKIHQKSPPFSNAKSPNKIEEKSTQPWTGQSCFSNRALVKTILRLRSAIK